MSLFDEKEIDEAAHKYFREGQLGFQQPGSEAGFKAGVAFAEQKCLDAVSNIVIENQGLKLLKDNFPNGLTSYLETYYEVVDKITVIILDGYCICNKIEALQSSIGHGGLWDLARELTYKFELQYKDEKWIDKDWFETIEEFLNKELYE